MLSSMERATCISRKRLNANLVTIQPVKAMEELRMVKEIEALRIVEAWKTTKPCRQTTLTSIIVATKFIATGNKEATASSSEKRKLTVIDSHEAIMTEAQSLLSTMPPPDNNATTSMLLKISDTLAQKPDALACQRQMIHV